MIEYISFVLRADLTSCLATNFSKTTNILYIYMSDLVLRPFVLRVDA